MRTHPLARHCLIAVALSAASTGIHAQALEQQYNLALENNLDLASSTKQHLATELDSVIADAAFRPTLSGSASNAHNLDSGSNTETYTASLGMNLSIPAFHGKDAYLTGIEKSEVELKNEHTLLIADTINNYFSVIKEQISIDSINAQIKSAQQSLATIQKQQQLGLATNLQVENIRNNLQQLQLSSLIAEQNLQEARNAISLSTGLPISETLPSIKNDKFLPELTNTSFEYWWPKVELQNLTLQAKRLSVEQNYHSYKQTEADKYPSGSATFTHNFNNSSNMLTLQIGGSFYDGGVKQTLTKKKQLAWLASKDVLNNTIESTKQLLSILLYRLENNAEQIRLRENLLESSKSSLTSVQKEYQLGVKDLFAVLEAQQALAVAEVNLANSRYDHISLQVNIKQTAGTLTRADLLALDQLLD